MIVSRNELASILGVTPRRVSQLVAERVIREPVSHGEYDLAASVQSILDFWQARALFDERLLRRHRIL